MQLTFMSETEPTPADHRRNASQRLRAGTTAMEYLMMLSLIVVVALIGIGYFGSMTANVTQATTTAITNSTKKG